MIFTIPQLVQEISKVMTLEEGDLILTGTPAGVSRVDPGQVIDCELIDGDKVISKLQFKTIERK